MNKDCLLIFAALSTTCQGFSFTSGLSNRIFNVAFQGSSLRLLRSKTMLSNHNRKTLFLKASLSGEDDEASIIAWKKLERVLTEKAKAEARARAEAKVKESKRKAKSILVWDVMNTICYDPFYEEIPAFFGMSLSNLYQAKNSSSWEAFELGRITEEEMLQTFFKDRRTFDHRGFVDIVKSKYAFLPGMERLLDELTGLGFPMHTMSNYPAWFKEIEQRLTLSRFLRWTFVSCDSGLRKPDAAAFTWLCERLNVSPDRCILIDDSEVNVAAAEKVGWKGLLFRDAITLRADLIALGIRLD